MHDAGRRALDRAGEEQPALSRQVLREYLAVVTRPQTWSVPLPRTQAIADVLELSRAFAILEDGPAVTPILLDLCRDVPEGGRQVHDANIVATLLAHGERRLLTFNDGDFIRFMPRIEIERP